MELNMLNREREKNLAEKKPCTNILNIYIKKKRQFVKLKFRYYDEEIIVKSGSEKASKIINLLAS